jgi:hypothetical protein
MPVAHERFAKVASSILLLRADDCSQRFHTARVISRHGSKSEPLKADMVDGSRKSVFGNVFYKSTP